MPYASYEYQGRAYVGRVEGDALVALDGPSELGVQTPREVLEAMTARPAGAVPLAEVRIRPVVPQPNKIICVGHNYRDHVGETGRDLPDYPVMFTKFAASLIGAYDDIVIPPESTQVDFEGELAIVIGRAGRRIAAAEVFAHILGFTVANDVTMRDYQYKTHQWLQGKAWDRSTPLGPHLFTPREIDVSAVGLRTTVNEVEVQASDTSRLIFDVPSLVAKISEFTTLLPGDVILTGTPGGVGYRRDPQLFLTPGDEVVVEIDGLGFARNRVVSESV